MKYLKQFIEEKYRIAALGNLTTTACVDGEEVGVSLVIDGFEPGIVVWYADYANWLEEKLDELLEKKSPDEDEQITFTFEEFRNEVLTAMENKPKEWRDGQFVFNYIDEKYGVARGVQFVDGVDCFYDDSKIEEFITRSYEYIKNAEQL